MNWREEAIEKLKGYEAQRQIVEALSQEIKRLNGSNRGQGKDTPKGENNLVKLERQLTQARLWVEIVDRGLSVLREDERLVLYHYYMHRVKGALLEICYQLGIEKSTVYERRDKALHRFTTALYG